MENGLKMEGPSNQGQLVLWQSFKQKSAFPKREHAATLPKRQCTVLMHETLKVPYSTSDYIPGVTPTYEYIGLHPDIIMLRADLMKLMA